MNTFILVLGAAGALLVAFVIVRAASRVGRGLVRLSDWLLRPPGPAPQQSCITGFPFPCPACGQLLAHLVCGSCRAAFADFEQCPHCGQRVGSITCPACKAQIHLTRIED